MINTPYYLTESSIEGFAKADGGYMLTMSGLPEKELTFTLSESENPKPQGGLPVKTFIFLISFFGASIILIGGVITAVVLSVRKRKKEP